ncbi:MAG TPA: mechanosensitive ion channel domain-containing protein [Gemmatimonadaceae bacterium]|nr:mechanosensitive ion channel domain-containing protein [Gemmatimonadaceae bacterium]
MTVSTQLVGAFHYVFLGNPVDAWLTAALTAFVTLLVAIVLRRLLITRIGQIAERTTNNIDDMVVGMLHATRTWVLAAVALLLAVSPLHFPPAVARALGPATKLVLLWQAALWSVAAITFWVKHHMERRTGSHDRTSVAMITAMGVGAKIFIWVLIVLTALKSVFNVEITALITGLGVSGIAVALAVQNILADLLAALAIVFDKPFDLGDSIGVDNINGTVEHIGLKTTRIRSQTGEQIIIGNGDLLKSRLRNYRRMFQRRASFNLDVPFDTPPDVLARIPEAIEAIVTAQKPIRFDRSHVASFTESGVRIETVYYVLDPDYKLYMDIQQAINLEILRRFTADRLHFALPSRTVYHEGPVGRDLSVGRQPQAAGES